MSEEQAGTLNNESAGESSQPVATHQSDDLVPTVDQPIPEAEAPDGNSSGETQNPQDQEDGEAKAGDAEKEDGEKLPHFHEHPRFQEIIRENRTLKERLDAIEQKQTSPEDAGKDAEEPEFKDLSGMDDDDLVDLMEDNPKEFIANIVKQAKAEFMGDLQKQHQEQWEQERQQKAVQSIDAFAKENPDFDKLWDDGKIQKFMEDNPAHNAISAYFVLKKDDFQQEALKKAEEKLTRDLRVKRSAQVLGGGPSTTGRPARQVPVELKETKKYGGLTSVLAQRSAQRRKVA
jgi:hypothetical protein